MSCWLGTHAPRVIGGGAILFSAIMERFGMEKITVSESDNLEGYALSRLETEEKQ